MIKFITLFILVNGIACSAYGQNMGEEYSQLKVFKTMRKAAKSRSERIILNLRGKNLSSLPENIGNLQNVVVMNLSQNKIKNFPPSFWKLTRLEVLIIGDNNLDSLPQNIGSLKGLKKLYLSRNHLSSLPKELTELKALEVLDLSFNNLIDKDADFIRDALPNCFVLVYVKL